MKKIILFFVILIAAISIYVLAYNAVYSYSSKPVKRQVLVPSEKVQNWYISEKNYASDMESKVYKLTDSLERKGKFINNGHTIAYSYYLQDSARANLVVSHGYTERKEKYKELIYYFLNMGYSVFVLDHYSHGESSRHSADSSLIYVDNYNIFTSDLNVFIQDVVKLNSAHLKTILYAHSMGGGIAARTLEQNPTLVDAVILNAPMMKLAQSPPDAIKDVVAHVMIMAGKGASYALGHRAYDVATDVVYNPDVKATMCDVRAAFWYSEFQKLTSQPSNGVSWNALSEFLKLGHDVVRKENVEKIKVPILLFQAEKDKYVAPEGHYEFAKHASNIDFYYVKGAGHEIYLESDSIIVPYYSIIHSFVERIIATK